MRIKYTKEILAPVIAKSKSWKEVLNFLKINLHGGNRHHMKKLAIKFNIDYSHFTGRAWNKGLVLPNKRRSPKDILKRYEQGSNRQHGWILRRALLESGIEEECNFCGIEPFWQNQSLRLEVDHIDGNALNCLITNLRFLCPNCHSQTSKYKNYGGSIRLVTEPVLKTVEHNSLSGSTPLPSA